jgi:hypothetical protein
MIGDILGGEKVLLETQNIGLVPDKNMMFDIMNLYGMHIYVHLYVCIYWYIYMYILIFLSLILHNHMVFSIYLYVCIYVF